MPMMEKRPHKPFRPCPSMRVEQNWATRGKVEIFDCYLWKPAIVSEVIDDGLLFMIKLNQTTKRLKTNKSQLRVPQSWHNDEWIVIRKKPIVHQVRLAATKTGVWKSNKMPSRMLKRGSGNLSS